MSDFDTKTFADEIDVLNPGEKVLVFERRQFDNDVRRHFSGIVQVCSAIAFRAIGYTFIYRPVAATFARKPEKRTRIISFNNFVVINILPESFDLENAQYKATDSGTIFTDGSSYQLDVS
ncbi:MAG: hypothetical protein R3245_09000, partial [Kiloniellales bacterium]|nr:hypothetical protein [Kiloniellales bacterium]